MTARTTVQIPLDDALVNGFRRRGRRKLREIEEACPDVLVKFDKASGCLVVKGAWEAVRRVQDQVDCMRGPRKQLSPALWAELMRTRSCPLGVLERLQAAVGARLHIERQRSEVRIFGPIAAVAQAELLLDRMELACVEVCLEGVATPSQEELELWSSTWCVSFRREAGRLWVLGFRALVQRFLRAADRRAGGAAAVSVGARMVDDIFTRVSSVSEHEVMLPPRFFEEVDDQEVQQKNCQIPSRCPDFHIQPWMSEGLPWANLELQEVWRASV